MTAISCLADTVRRVRLLPPPPGCGRLTAFSGVSGPFTVGVHRSACSCGGDYTAVGAFRLVHGFLLSRARKFTRPSITLVNFCNM